MSEKNSRPVSAGIGQSTQPRAKKKSKFLSFLCCGSSDESGETGQELTQAPRQSAIVQPSQPAQPPPATSKQLPVTPHDRNNEPATSVLDEKASASPPYATHGSGAPASFDREKAPMTDSPATDKPMPALSADQPVQQSTTHVPAFLLPLGVGSAAAGAYETSKHETPKLDTSVASDPTHLDNPDVVVQAPTPVVPQREDQLISDRTPEQQARDMDIEMTDVGPSLPLSANDVSGTSEDESHVAAHSDSQNNRVDLPPPPPLEERHAQVIPESNLASHDTSLVPSPEQQKWLLPPIRPEFRGKKCLVLDLDETLVHSSFKVRHILNKTFPTRQLTGNRFFTKQISPFQ